MKLLPPLFASYPRQGRVAPTLLIASICRQLQHPVQACPFCHNVDKDALCCLPPLFKKEEQIAHKD